MTIKFTTKVSLLLTLGCLSVASLISGVAFYQQSKLVENAVTQTRRVYYADYDKGARGEVETVVSLVGAVYERSRKEGIPLDDAKKMAADLVRSLRYDRRTISG